MPYRRQAETLVRQLEIAPFLDTLEAEAPGSVDPDIWAAIVEQAARFAEGVIDPVDAALDRQGASVRDGRVVTADGHRAAWRRFADDGWLTLALPEAAIAVMSSTIPCIRLDVYTDARGLGKRRMLDFDNS